MRPRSSLAVFGLLVWLALGLVTPGTTGAAAGNWTVTGAPLMLNYGSPSTIDVTITGGTTPIGCIEVMLTSKDAADSATIVVRPLLATWTATIVQGGRDAVLLRAASDADRLTLAKVLTVAIQVTTTGQHTETWQVIGHQGETTSSSTKGLGTKTISPIVVIGARPTPSLSPSRTPTPTPTPTPPPSKGPGSPLSTPRPTVGTGGGSGALGGGPPAGSLPPDGSGGGVTVPYVGTSTNGDSATGGTPTVSLGNVTFGSSIRWLIPTFALSLPGMLIVGAVAIQLLTGLTFVELTRRWLGAVFRKRRSTETGSRP